MRTIASGKEITLKDERCKHLITVLDTTTDNDNCNSFSYFLPCYRSIRTVTYAPNCFWVILR